MSQLKLDDWSNNIKDLKTTDCTNFTIIGTLIILLVLLSNDKIDLEKIWDSCSQATEVVQSLIDKTWDAICRSLQP